MRISGRPALIVLAICGLCLGFYRLYDTGQLLRRASVTAGTVEVVSRRTVFVRVESPGRSLSVPVKRPLFGFYRSGDRLEIYFDPAENFEATGFPFEFGPQRRGRVANAFHLWFPLAVGGGCALLLLAGAPVGSLVRERRPLVGPDHQA